MLNKNMVKVERRKKNGDFDLIYDHLGCDLQSEKPKTNYYAPFKQSLLKKIMFVDKILITNPIKDRDVITDLDTGEKFVAVGNQYGGNLIKKRLQVVLNGNID